MREPSGPEAGQVLDIHDKIEQPVTGEYERVLYQCYLRLPRILRTLLRILVSNVTK